MCACLLFIGCSSTNPGTRQVVIEHQRRIDELEGRNRELENRIAQYEQVVRQSIENLTAIGNRAEGMGNKIDRIIYLFAEYKRTVEQVIRSLNSIQTPAAAAPESIGNSSNNTDSTAHR